MREASPRLVVFDLDGTLVDSHASITGCFRAAMDASGLPAVDEAAVTALIGLPLRQMFARLLPDLSAAERDRCEDRYRRTYADFDRRLTRPFAGVVQVVRALRQAGVATAIATSKSRVGLDRTVGSLGLVELFDLTLSVDDVTRPKPHPEMLHACCDVLGVGAERAVMVGDTTYDVEMGVRGGCHAIGVTWGAHDRARLEAAGAHAVVEEPAALGRLLR